MRQAFLAVGAMCALSGGLHEDGLVDSADGLWGGTNPEQRLAIMHDSRVGVFGLIGCRNGNLFKSHSYKSFIKK